MTLACYLSHSQFRARLYSALSFALHRQALFLSPFPSVDHNSPPSLAWIIIVSFLRLVFLISRTEVYLRYLLYSTRRETGTWISITSHDPFEYRAI
ncbi:uncharacterized protein IAS62_003603 [Cryptococcus decagattii]|uniref:Uncharacterized protein n=1 Tax=Cryptococcus decagattii TaxID=1859122 RepID=A0ABZ2AUQ9_9TREE